MKRYVPIIALDFDGVIHSYTSGWQGPRKIPDKPVDGVLGWIEAFCMDHCCPDSICAMAPAPTARLVIFSSRSRYPFARMCMKAWMVLHGFDRRFFEVIKFPLFKPPAHVTVDDRVVCFDGRMPDCEHLMGFNPWNKKEKP